MYVFDFVLNIHMKILSPHIYMYIYIYGFYSINILILFQKSEIHFFCINVNPTFFGIGLYQTLLSCKNICFEFIQNGAEDKNRPD